MSKREPMDPEWIDRVRQGLDSRDCAGEAAQGDQDNLAVPRRLLIDRDYHAHRADSAEAEVARLRARVRVEAGDVERSGVKWARVTAWLRVHGWSVSRGWGLAHNDGGKFQHWRLGKAWVCVHENESASCVVACIDALGRHYRRLQLDILDEMAAMEIQS